MSPTSLSDGAYAFAFAAGAKGTLSAPEHASGAESRASPGTSGSVEALALSRAAMSTVLADVSDDEGAGVDEDSDDAYLVQAASSSQLHRLTEPLRPREFFWMKERYPSLVASSTVVVRRCPSSGTDLCARACPCSRTAIVSPSTRPSYCAVHGAPPARAMAAAGRAQGAQGHAEHVAFAASVAALDGAERDARTDEASFASPHPLLDSLAGGKLESGPAGTRSALAFGSSAHSPAPSRSGSRAAAASGAGSAARRSRAPERSGAHSVPPLPMHGTGSVAVSVVSALPDALDAVGGVNHHSVPSAAVFEVASVSPARRAGSSMALHSAMPSGRTSAAGRFFHRPTTPTAGASSTRPAAPAAVPTAPVYVPFQSPKLARLLGGLSVDQNLRISGTR